MSELENVVSAVEGEVKTVAEAVVAETQKVEGEVAAEVKKVEEKVKAEFVQIVADEKLTLREAELEYLKLQMEIKRLSDLAEGKAKSYQKTVEELFVKYGLTKAEYLFDGAVNVFKRL